MDLLLLFLTPAEHCAQVGPSWHLKYQELLERLYAIQGAFSGQGTAPASRAHLKLRREAALLDRQASDMERKHNITRWSQHSRQFRDAAERRGHLAILNLQGAIESDIDCYHVLSRRIARDSVARHRHSDGLRLASQRAKVLARIGSRLAELQSWLDVGPGLGPQYSLAGAE
jgi:hypothetical protein